MLFCFCVLICALKNFLWEARGLSLSEQYCHQINFISFLRKSQAVGDQQFFLKPLHYLDILNGKIEFSSGTHLSRSYWP